MKKRKNHSPEFKAKVALEASLVREALEGYAIGRFQSQAEVLRFLENYPYFPRGKNGHVLPKRVSDMLNQPLYAGYICSEVYALDWRKGHHEPLISMKTHEKIQERRHGAAYAPAKKNIGQDFALRGFVCCAECGTVLKSSWSKGATKRYAYYLCQTKGCDSYGKSIPRAKLEGAFGELVKTMEPSPNLLALAKVMFKDAWTARLGSAKDVVQAAKRQIADADTQIENLLERIMKATNDSVIGAYEQKIGDLEKTKVRMHDNLAHQTPPAGRFEDTLELSMKFLSSPWKLWETGDITLRRILLRLAFTGQVLYHRNEGARTPEISLPFKALGVFKCREHANGAAGEN